QWPDEFLPTEPYRMLDEQGSNVLLTNALEQYKRSALLQEYPESPATYDTDDDVEVSSADAHTDSLYPSPCASSMLRFTLRTNPRYAGLPGSKDLRDFSVKKAEHIKRKTTKGTQRSCPVQAVHKGVEKGGSILSALFYFHRNPEAKASTSTIASRQVPSDEYHTPPDEHEDSRLMRKSRKQEKADIDRKRVHERESRHFDIPPIFGYVTRPAVARGAGGVFGPLIASISTIAGIGAPHASLIPTNVKWPGSSLSRMNLYLLQVFYGNWNAVGPSPIRRRLTREYRDSSSSSTSSDDPSITSLDSSTTPNGSNSLIMTI
ncbi:hypothetical protein BJ912DRAFT_981878, partial [Pholiota molesta]